jgi:hypothetical protein
MDKRARLSGWPLGRLVGVHAFAWQIPAAGFLEPGGIMQ